MSDMVKADVYETLPALVGGDAEVLARLEGLFLAMTTVPEGMEESNLPWRPEVIKLKQKTSTDSATPGNAKDGDIWANGRVLWSRNQGTDDPFLIVPVYHWVSHSRFQNNERNPNCQSDDGVWAHNGTECKTCPTRPWKDGRVQDCRRSYNFLCMSLDLSGIFLISFSKTSARAGTAIASTAQQRGRPLWHNVYALTSTQNTNQAGQSWYTFASAPRFDIDPPVEADAFGRFVKEQYQAIRAEKLTTQAEARDFVTQTLEGDGGGDDLPPSDDDDGGGFDDAM